MTFEETLRELETPRLAARLGVVSTPRSLERAIASESSVRRLLGMLSSPNNRRRLYGHLMQLLNQPSDDRFAHPMDLALAVYIRLLDIADPELGEMAAVETRQRPNLWWTRALAATILAKSAQRTRTVRTEQISDPTSLRSLRVESPAVSDYSGAMRWTPETATLPSVRTSTSVARANLFTSRPPLLVNTSGVPV
jgi:hypothetical protein